MQVYYIAVQKQFPPCFGIPSLFCLIQLAAKGFPWCAAVIARLL